MNTIQNVYIDDNGNKINLDKLRYDLAMLYTKHKLQQFKLENEDTSYDYVECTDRLIEWFGNSYQELCNLDIDYLINKIDCLHEYNKND